MLKKQDLYPSITQQSIACRQVLFSGTLLPMKAPTPIFIIILLAISITSHSAFGYPEIDYTSVYDLPNLEELSTDDPTHRVSIKLQEATVDIGRGLSMRTRAFNRKVPGPTIKLKPGQLLALTYTNRLLRSHSTNPKGEQKHVDNKLSGVRQTNLHLHGLHIDGDWPSDTVALILGPRERHTYVAKIVSTHLPGTHWIHPHRHGSTSLQVGGGAASLLIIEDKEVVGKFDDDYDNSLMPLPSSVDWDDSPLPPTLQGIDEVNLVFQPIYNWTELNEKYEDDLFRVYWTETEVDYTEPLVLVNGKLKPTVTVEAGVWYRFRILNADRDRNNFRFNVTIPREAGICYNYLIAKDGVYITDWPRLIEGALIPPGGRADVLLLCNLHSTANALLSVTAPVQGYSPPVEHDPDDPLAGKKFPSVSLDVSVQMSDANGKRPPRSGSWTAPDLATTEYLEDTIQSTVEPECDCYTNLNHLNFDKPALPQKYLVSGDPNDNGTEYKSNNRIHTSVIGKVARRNLSAAHHPYHQHIIPFQILNGTASDDSGYEPYFKEGDWHDVWDGDGIIQFRPTRFAGKMIFHCHRLEHEDQGMMSTERILPKGEDSQCQCKSMNLAPEDDEDLVAKQESPILYAFLEGGALVAIGLALYFCFKKCTGRQGNSGEAQPLI